MPERAAAGEAQQMLLVTTTNDARKNLNLEIRRALVTGRETDEGRSFQVLAPVRLGITVKGYQLGDTVHFSGERAGDGRTVAWGARLHAEGKVVGLDRERKPSPGQPLLRAPGPATAQGGAGGDEGVLRCRAPGTDHAFTL